MFRCAASLSAWLLATVASACSCTSAPRNNPEGPFSTLSLVHCPEETEPRVRGFLQWQHAYLLARCQQEDRLRSLGGCTNSIPRACAASPITPFDPPELDWLYDATCGQQCLDALAATTPAEGTTMPVPCLDALERHAHSPRTAGEGEPCLDAECNPGLYCRDGIHLGTSGGPVQCPPCRELHPPGAPCTSPLECQSGVCASGGPATCRDAPVAPAAGVLGAACNDASNCLSGLCVGGRCAATGKGGAMPCSVDQECEGYCSAGGCACPPAATPDGAACEGESCLRGARCLELTPGARLCQRLLDDGVPCFTAAGQSACKGICLAVSPTTMSVCASRTQAPGDGQACAASPNGVVCSTGTTPIFDANGCTCRAPAPAGSPCQDNKECISQCVAGTCAAPLPDGAPCSTHGECESGACQSVCRPRGCGPVGSGSSASSSGG